MENLAKSSLNVAVNPSKLQSTPTFDFGINLEEPVRFASASDEEILEMMKKMNAPKTDQSTDFALKLFKAYCAESKIDFPEGNHFSESHLNKTLAKFYIGARTKKGDLYKLNSMKGIRFSLQRYFLESNNCDIINISQSFQESNIVFNNVLKAIKASGKGDTTHYAEIEPEDLQKLFAGIDTNTAAGLQELVWFNIMYFLIRRGRENIRKMDKNTFSVSQDASGRKYIFQTNGEFDKNHGINDGTFETNGEGCIYETKTEKCPVKLFLQYKSLLHPDLNALWQRPRAKVGVLDNTWYCNVPLGEKYLGNMMAMMSAKYKLSQRYTNHCLRVTSLQVLDDENIDSRHIIRVSGHKNPESVTNYARRLSASKKRKISSILSTSIGEKKTLCVSDTASHNQQKPNAKEPVLSLADDNNDALDTIFAQIPQNLLYSQQDNAFNVLPRVFTPVLNNCSGITFNVNILK